MIGSATSRVDEAASDSGDEELIGDNEFHGAVKFLTASLQHGAQFLGLRDCAWEAVQNKPALDDGSMIERFNQKLSKRHLPVLAGFVVL